MDVHQCQWLAKKKKKTSKNKNSPNCDKPLKAIMEDTLSLAILLDILVFNVVREIYTVLDWDQTASSIFPMKFINILIKNEIMRCHRPKVTIPQLHDAVKRYSNVQCQMQFTHLFKFYFLFNLHVSRKSLVWSWKHTCLFNFHRIFAREGNRFAHTC